MTGNPLLLVIVAGIMFAVLGGVTLLSHIYSLNGIKSKTVGDGQHGTARWATKAEIKKISMGLLQKFYMQAYRDKEGFFNEFSRRCEEYGK